MTRRTLVVAATAVAVAFGPACASVGRSAGSEEAVRPEPVVVPRFTPAPPVPSAPPAVPTTPSLEAAASPACVLTAKDVELTRGVPLRVDDSAPFFHVAQAKALEVRLASPRSTLQASRADLEIIGHVRASEVPVRLRSDALVDGYLRVNHATLRDGDPERLVLVVDPPPFLQPVEAPVRAVRCGDLALARKVARAEAPLRGKRIDLRLGAPIAVRAAPGGHVVATIWLPKPDPRAPALRVDVYELELRGEQVRVSIGSDRTDVEGWVSRHDLAAHPEPKMWSVLGAFGGGGATIALASEVPLIVRTGDSVVRVGTARPGTFDCRRSAGSDSPEIELGFDGPFAGLGLASRGAGPQPAPAKLLITPRRGEVCVEAPKRDR